MSCSEPHLAPTTTGIGIGREIASGLSCDASIHHRHDMPSASQFHHAMCACLTGASRHLTGAAPNRAALWNEAQCFRRALELLPKLWRGNRDQPCGALGEVASMKRRNAILSHHIVDVRPRGCHRGARSE